MPDDPALFALAQFDQILAAARGGNSAVVGVLFTTFGPALLSFASRKLPADLRAKIDPADLVQTVFEKAFAALAQFHGESEKEFRAWLMAFLLHAIAHVNRDFRPGSKRDVGRERNHLWGGDSVVAQSREPPTLSPSPCDDAQAQEWDDAFRLALGRLPDDVSQPLQLKILYGLSFVEMGHRLGISANAAQKRFDRALERFEESSPIS